MLERIKEEEEEKAPGSGLRFGVWVRESRISDEDLRGRFRVWGLRFGGEEVGVGCCAEAVH